MPYKVYQDGDRWCVHKLDAQGNQGERVDGGCHDTETAAMRHQRALEANVEELTGPFVDVMHVAELRGNYPDVQPFADIDLAELTRGDSDPVFLTIPIGKANALSGNGRFYDEAFLAELERQVATVRPIGLMGHLTEEELGSAFPDEAIHWVGAQRVGELLWGKGYVPPGPARDRVRRYKATNKSLATSIFAKARGIWNKARGAFDMVAETLQLQQIDIGPADRVGIRDLASVPILTAEMQGAVTTGEPEEHDEMDKLQVINEMTAEDARLLPEAVRQAILAGQQEPPEVAQVQELRQALGVDETADLVTAVSELRQAQETARQRAISDRISELAADAETGIKLAPVRAIVVEMVQLRNPQTVEEAETAYTAVAESERIQEMLKLNVQSAMGPNQRTRVQGQNGGGTIFKIPAKETD